MPVSILYILFAAMNIKIYLQERKFATSFLWVWNMVSYLKEECTF